MWALIVLLVVCGGCGKGPERAPHAVWEEFKGRDEVVGYGEQVRKAVYRAQVPVGWKRLEEQKGAGSDTMQPIVAFKVVEGVTVTVHTFPTNSLEERIPPSAQVQRWQGQLKGGASRVVSAGHGGFAGLYMEGEKEGVAVRAWSMQLDMQHYQTLRFVAQTVEEEEHNKQMAADYTIKAYGTKALLDKHRAAIDLFANTFELIQELPTRS